MFRIAARLGYPNVDPEDAAQEVFVVAARKLDTFDGSSLITTWLYGITLNVVRTLRRKARFRSLFETSEDRSVDVPTRSVDRVEVVEAHRIAYGILNKMTAAKRETFILAEFANLSSEEISQITGAKLETVWSRLHYSRKEFGKALLKFRTRQSVD